MGGRINQEKVCLTWIHSEWPLSPPCAVAEQEQTVEQEIGKGSRIKEQNLGIGLLVNIDIRNKIGEQAGIKVQRTGTDSVTEDWQRGQHLGIGPASRTINRL